jgi:hypothetical protein
MHVGGYRTLDGYSAWQDEDGAWYCGPAEEEIRQACANSACGWRISISKRRGKEVSRLELSV